MNAFQLDLIANEPFLEACEWCNVVIHNAEFQWCSILSKNGIDIVCRSCKAWEDTKIANIFEGHEHKL